MKLFFADKTSSDLADEKSVSLFKTKEALLNLPNILEASSPEESDAIIIQEKNSFKNFRYIAELLTDPLIGRYANKVFTINDDDCATGLLKGLYTSLPKYRFNENLHIAVPYMQYPNELVFSSGLKSDPEHLATWRGNTKSNKLRLKLVNALKNKPDVIIQQTDSWLNHKVDEKATYVELIRKARFSLCPAGWAPVSFRIYETMALGRCPVILADNFVPPLGPNWTEFAMFFPEKNVEILYEFLSVNQHRHNELGSNAYKNWEKYFAADKIGKYYASNLLSLISSNKIGSNESEFKRWRSIGLHWNNEWTIPQRLLNKAKRIATFF
jgi:hypothetical protein